MNMCLWMCLFFGYSLASAWFILQHFLWPCCATYLWATEGGGVSLLLCNLLGSFALAIHTASCVNTLCECEWRCERLCEVVNKVSWAWGILVIPISWDSLIAFDMSLRWVALFFLQCNFCKLLLLIIVLYGTGKINKSTSTKCRVVAFNTARKLKWFAALTVA